MNFKGLKMTLTNLGVMVTQLNNYKMRFVSDDLLASVNY